MPEPRDIHIHAGEESVITTTLAAKRYGVSIATMRSTLARLKAGGILEPVPEMLDERTPLYPLAELELVMDARPGKGSNKRRIEERPMAALTAAMQPAYESARKHLDPSRWPEDVTERAARELASELWRTRKDAGRGWRATIRALAENTDSRRAFTNGLLSSLRAQGAKEATVIPLDRAVQYAAQGMMSG